MNELEQARARIRAAYSADEADVVNSLLDASRLDASARDRIGDQAEQWVRQLRDDMAPSLMEAFLAEYGLSTQEGVALMCLAEAYLRVPDPETLDALIQDKIGTGQWSAHQRQSRSSLVNASSWALMLTGKIYASSTRAETQVTDTVRRLVKRVGEPVVRSAVAQAMKVLGQQFVRGRDIDEAIRRGEAMVRKGYRYSYDMLGEAAKTAEDARRYFLAYSGAITHIARHAEQPWVHDNPGISIKLSALHPRYESVQRTRVLRELVPRLGALALLARNANIGLNIDAEEADRLDLSLDVIERVLDTPDLAGWDGFGIVVQAYSKQAMPVLNWVRDLAGGMNRRVSVRLVKGAYWDMEIKNAQVLGLGAYPVFTRKPSTDVSYLACARFLLDNADRIYPQFATHNAHTAAAILEMAGEFDGYEFQRLHGMGEALYEIIRKQTGRRCRIYAPVGVHKDLLAYLVRRLLENGANSSFVHQLLNTEVKPSELVADPLARTEAADPRSHPGIPLPPALFEPQRRNSRGWNINHPHDAEELERAMNAFQAHRWRAMPGIECEGERRPARPVFNPADLSEQVGEVSESGADDAPRALRKTTEAFPKWAALTAERRASILESIADQFERNAAELMALLTREAGKTRLDGVLEVREAVDFCRYYAQQARTNLARKPLGTFVCISPWNFPLAIFTGQICAALVSGNTVVAKPAEQTPLIAARAVDLMHAAGVPEDALVLLPGDGAEVGAALVAHPDIAGVCFTGSTETAIRIDRAMARSADPQAPLIAETGGVNAMIVDSTALPEHAVRDIVASAFQSAGQRCSALRVLFLQNDVAGHVLEMLEGAARELVIGNPWNPAVDVGPAIDAEARLTIVDHCERLAGEGRLLFRHPLPDVPDAAYFVPPVALRLNSLQELEREIFGPVLHVVTFEAEELDSVVDQINASGYGLTLGVHSRVGDRVDRVCARARIGNVYVNRNQIGAVVGVQPFGGEGLSGTGPKAGGPHYLAQFGRLEIGRTPRSEFGVPKQPGTVVPDRLIDDTPTALSVEGLGALRQLVAGLDEPLRSAGSLVIEQVAELMGSAGELPGPTGERNTLALYPRGRCLCLGGGEEHDLNLALQMLGAVATGNRAVVAARTGDLITLDLLKRLEALDSGRYAAIRIEPPRAGELPEIADLRLVLAEGSPEDLRGVRVALAERDGVRIPLVTASGGFQRHVHERVVSVDTTASGGNTSLLTLSE